MMKKEREGKLTADVYIYENMVEEMKEEGERKEGDLESGRVRRKVSSEVVDGKGEREN